MKTVLKILTALAAIAGIVYAVATYGDRIVAWAKRLLGSCPFKYDVTVTHETAEEAPAEETPVEEAPVEETPAEETPEVSVVVDENEPVAEETDFEA